MGNKFVEQTQIVSIIAPLDLDTDRTGDFVSMKNWGKAVLIFETGVGTATDDWNFTLRQATVVAGTDAKDLDSIQEYWIKQAATSLAATGTFTRTTQTADALISGDATSAEEATLVIVEVNAEQLDVANGFDCISANVTLDASAGAQLGYVVCILMDARYPQATTASAIVD